MPADFLAQSKTFKRFASNYRPTTQEFSTSKVVDEGLLFGSKAAIEFVNSVGGTTFNHGSYRVHQANGLAHWNHIVSEAFPQQADSIRCFGYDWLGRQFALDHSRLEEGHPLVLMLEPGTGFALEIPADFVGFHELVLSEQADAALAVDAFNEYHATHPIDLPFDKCVGYRVPLFLGGADNASNYEVSDMEVYWSISAQLLTQTRDLPDGAKIGDVSMR